MIDEQTPPRPELQHSPLSETLKARLANLRHSPVVLVLWICLTVLGVIAQPYDSYGILPVWARVLYWGGIVGIGIVAADLVDCLARRLTPDGHRIKIAVKAVGLATLFLSPVFIAWNELFVLMFPDMDDSPLLITFRVFATSIPVFALIEALRPNEVRGSEVAPYEEPAPEPCPEALRPRLSVRLQCPDAKILRLSANNHLIDVISERGIEQIRMRFADAVLEMEPVPGCCVHRSHWVALDAIEGLKRYKDKLFVRLSNGDEIPVSRTYRPELEAARPDLF